MTAGAWVFLVGPLMISDKAPIYSIAQVYV